MYLNCHTYYSLRFGTLSPRELLARAKVAGLRKIALTDINNTSCMLDFYQECLQQEIAPVAGIEFRSSAGKLLYIGLAKNNKGFYQLNQFLSSCSEEGRELPERAPVLADTFFIYPISYDLRQPLEEHEFIGIRPQEVSRLYSSPVRYALNKAVILQSVSFGGPEAYTLHCLLQAIDQNVVLSRLDKTHLAHPEDGFMPQEKLLACFEAYPKVIENTEKLLAACSIHFDLKSPKNRSSFTGSRKDDRLLLEKLARDGFRQRYPNPGREVVQRFEREISMIDQLGFSPYFLITHDIIRYAQLRGSRHVGRGSGANSLIAYCLDITEVDPVALNLYFERFINPHRSSPPDFDIDFCWDERDEVVDYIFKRFANGHVALLAAINTFQPRALIRELGKVYGLPGQEVETLLKQAGRYHHRQPQEPKQQQADEIGQKILYYAEQLSGFPNYLSIHAGGVLITEEPLHNYSAKMMMPKGFPVVHFDMHTAEEFGFYKYDILSQRGLGHIKDSLRLIKENRGEEVDIRQTEKLKKDEKVRERLLNAQTIGCFYIESPGMRGLLSKLHCNTFETLVAASSIIRPGVAQSGMMQEYIRRHNNPGKIEYLHPVFEELLAETYGIMVYQEDVLKIAHHFAGLELGEADVLRRGMSGKGRSSEQMVRIQEKFFRGCQEKGHSEALSREVWRQIESFAGYSFCKAHSASYAVESFQSLYLKAYYPLEFMVGVINNFGGFYALEHYVHEARMCGAKIEPPCVNHSQYLATIKGTTIYLGFVHLKELEAATARQLIDERESNGLYQGFADFLQRVPLKKEQLNLLIRINAFRFSGKSRQALLWEKSSYSLKTPLPAAGKAASKRRASKRNASGGTVPGAAAASSADQHSAARRGTANRGGVINEADHNGAAPREAAYSGAAFSLSLFTNPVEKDAKLPPLDIHVLEDAFEQIELLGFPLCSPFLLLEHKPDSSLHTKDLLTHIGRSIDIAGYFITRKVVRTKHGKLMSFGTWIDEAGFFFDTTHFPQSLEKHPFRGPGCYRIEGKVVEEFGFPSIEVQKMEHLKMITDARFK